MISATNHTANLANLRESVSKGVPMLEVRDIAATLDWYASVGFHEVARYAEDGIVNFGLLSFGRAELMFRLGENPQADAVRLWFYTDQVDELYAQFKNVAGMEFPEEIYDPFYGGRQFSIRDLNGYTLVFLQPGQ